MKSGNESLLFEEALDLLCTKVEGDEQSIGVSFPYVTHPDGSWDTMLASLSAGYRDSVWSHGNWFCGFWIGLLIAAFHQSGEPRFLDLAKERMRMVAPRAADPNTHDIGFIFWSSAIPLYRATGDESFAVLALEAAGRLRARLVSTAAGAYLSSWGPLSDPRGRASSAIDTMANIPLLYWASEHSGDDSYRLAGEAHAAMTERAFIRPDRTLYHAVEYDAQTGVRKRGYTFQGYSDESSWSRGTGWAVYGYAATAAATGQRRYLDIATGLAERWLGQLGERNCPPWDFDDPSERLTQDSSAGAIMAAALLDVGALHPDPLSRERWKGEAVRLLQNLVDCCLARDPKHRGLLLHGCYSMPHTIGVDAAVMFGDYYFIEAIARLQLPGKIVKSFDPLPA